MSGIYGIYQYDGAPVTSQTMDRMSEAMAFYGPHGGGCKVEGSLGLGHLLLEVNPEDAFEKQPMRCARGPAVSAARLDNRTALLDAFKVPESEASQLSDGHLVSLAFDRWGEDLCSHLQGDWALAAWDARERRLLLARDACGSSTLYCYEGNGFIAFASSMKALLTLPGVVREPDRLRLAQVLVSWQHDAQLTAYKGFQRLVWAHAMTVGSDGQTRIWRHWSPEGRGLLNYRRDAEYEEAFLEHYTRAVQSCLRTQRPVAATLSGGRDSGSVVSLAAPLLGSQGRGLTAYTSVPCLPPDGARKQRFGNEWEMAHATATMAGANVQHAAIDAANYGVIQGVEYLLDTHDGPGHAPSNQYWLKAINDAVSQGGAGALLTGQFGNAAVSWSGNGSALLALLQGNPAVASRLFLHGEPNPWLTLKRQVLKPLLMPGLRAFRRLKSPRNAWQAYSALNIHMADEVDLNGRMHAAGYDPTFTFSPLENVQLRFFWPVFGLGFGIGAEQAARHSFSSLDPTANLSLIEFILCVPDDQFRLRGQGSWLMRRAFRNRLPAAVLNGQHKGLQAADLGHRILCELPAFREILNSLDSLPEARAMLDMPLLHRCLDDLVAKVDPGTTARAVTILVRGLGVGMFLLRLADSRS
jgi:asparagine synthase (glutamine-hydrolysing)